VSDRSGLPDGRVRIVESNGEFVGRVVAVYSPPAEKPDPLCERCSGARKDQPVIGMTILSGVRRGAEGYTTGEILDPDDGNVYRCTLELLEGGRKLGVRGYLGIPLLGRTQVWTRLE
jgi:uncharacterized protein (DUF2147 family)